MLTNNKKRSFVKLIALTLAALMVFSVCLTGCTDQDARDQAADALNKAEDALGKADAAPTAEEVAAAIADAIAKIDNSVDEAAVKKLITDELTAAKVASTDDLVKYAEKTALDALTTKVNAIVPGMKEADVKAAISSATADYATKAMLNDYVKKGDFNAKVDELLGKINEINKKFNPNWITISDVEKFLKDNNYATKSDVDTAVKAALAQYVGDLKPADVLTALTAVVKTYGDGSDIMTLSQWNKATGHVIYLLTQAGEVFESAAKHIYDDATKAAINAAYNKCFEGNTNYDVFDADDTTHMTELAIAILRLPNEAAFEDMMANFEEMKNQESFEDKLEDLILADGKEGDEDFIELYEIGNLAAVWKDATLAAKDTYAAKTTYHGVDYAAGATILAQVVTSADVDDYKAFKDALDALLVAYAEDINAKTTIKYDVYKQAEKKETGKPDVTGYYKVTETLPAGYAWVDGTETVGIDTAITGVDWYDYTAIASTAGKYLEGYSDKKFDDPKIRVDLAGDYAATGLLTDVMARIEDDEAVNAMAAIETMFDDVDAAVAAVEEHFKAFLDHMIAPKAGVTVSNAEYVNALRDYMTTDDFHADIFVPDDWMTTSNCEYLDEIEQYYNYAMNIEGKTTADHLWKYDLYQLLAAEADLTNVEKWRDKALDIIDRMMNDYISAVDAAIAANNVNSAVETDTPVSFADHLYNGFDYTWDDTMLKDQKMLNLAQYWANSGAAWAPDLKAKDGALVTVEILKVLADNEVAIKHELSAATVNERDAIVKLDKKGGEASAKAEFIKQLETAKANLDEIIVRWAFEEIKQGIICNIYAKATEVAQTYSVDKPFTEAEILEALQWYLTGYTATSDKADAYTADSVTFKDFAIGDAQLAITAGTTWNAITAIKIPNRDEWVVPEKETGTPGEDDYRPAVILPHTATEKLDYILNGSKILTDAVETMENMAVAIRFDDYLAVARATLWFAYQEFKNDDVTRDYAVNTALTDAYNDALNTISAIEYKIYKSHSLEGHKDAYVKLLTVIIDKDSYYYALIPSIADNSFDKMIADKNLGALSMNATGYINLIKLTEKGHEYLAAGSAVNAFDRALNANAYKTVSGNTETLYK